jgi:hypothetical protein
VNENPILSVCWVDIDISGSFGLQSLFLQFFGIHLLAVLNTTLFLELTGSNGIFGDISDWFWFRNMTSSGSQHSV